MLPITEQLATIYVRGYEAIYSGSEESGESEPTINTSGDTLEFTAFKNASNLNLFNYKYSPGQSTIDTSNYIVNINGVDTDQAINKLTFVANDKIIIKKKDGVKYFPYFYCFTQDYIKSIDAPLPLMSLDFTNDATDFGGCFTTCHNLTSIPADIFKYNPNVTKFSSCFKNCIGLTSIPADIFKYNTSATHLGGCFDSCTGLTSIPTDLFRYNTATLYFGECFKNCTGLTSIPTDLFRYNTSATSFSSCFENCTGLTSIPTDLFRYNTAANNFYYCFSGCSNVTSALPELWVSHPSATHSSCFKNCTNASNYAAAQTAGWI